MSNWLGLAEGLVAGAVPVVGLVYTYLTNRRNQYDRVLAITAESGMPPVAEDRHAAGMAFEPLSKHPPGQPARLSEAEVKAILFRQLPLRLDASGVDELISRARGT